MVFLEWLERKIPDDGLRALSATAVLVILGLVLILAIAYATGLSLRPMLIGYFAAASPGIVIGLLGAWKFHREDRRREYHAK